MKQLVERLVRLREQDPDPEARDAENIIKTWEPPNDTKKRGGLPPSADLDRIQDLAYALDTLLDRGYSPATILGKANWTKVGLHGTGSPSNRRVRDSDSKAVLIKAVIRHLATKIQLAQGAAEDKKETHWVVLTHIFDEDPAVIHVKHDDPAARRYDSVILFGAWSPEGKGSTIFDRPSRLSEPGAPLLIRGRPPARRSS